MVSIDLLKSQFYKYFNENYSLDNYSLSESNPSENISVFISEHEKEFKDYLVNNLGFNSSILSYSINTIENMDLSAFVDSQNAPNSPAKPSYKFNFMDDMQEQLSQTDMDILGSLMDKDKDGTLSEEEQNTSRIFLSMLDGKDDDFTNDDIKAIKDYMAGLSGLNYSAEEIAKNIMSLDGNAEEISENDFRVIAQKSKELLGQLQEAQDMGIQPNSVMEDSGAGSFESSGSSGANTPKKMPFMDKNVENMSIEDLKQEQIQAKAQVEQAQQAYSQVLEKLDSELNNKINEIQTQKNTAQQTLTEKNTQYTSVSSELDSLNSSLTSKQASLSQVQSRIASLSSISDDENSESSKVELASLQAQEKQLQEEINDIQNNQIPQKEAEKKALETEIQELETNVSTLEQQEQEALNEVRALAQTNPELQGLMDNYDNAVQYSQKVDETLALREADKQKEENSNKPDKSEGPRDYRGNDEYDFTNMPLTYSIGDEEFNCVGIAKYDTDGDGKADFAPDSWDELQRILAWGENGNIYDLPMQCHNLSTIVGQLVMGVAHPDYVQSLVNEMENHVQGDSNKAGELAKHAEYNQRNFAKCISPSRDESREIIENELQNGRPVVVSVPYTGGSHYVLAVGMSDGGDILIWDSYNGAMEVLGSSSDTDTNKLHRNMASANAAMVFCENYRYDYGTARAIDYDKYITDGVDYVMQYGHK